MARYTFLVAAWAMADRIGTAGDLTIPVVVAGKADAAQIKVGDPIPLTVTITNGLTGPIAYSTFSLKPNDWNGETSGFSLMDIYRDGRDRNLYLERPKVAVPWKISGMGGHAVKPGGSLTAATDARKWTIDGGWVPGKYSVTVGVSRLTADGGRCVLSVTSAPFEFEIK